MFYSPPSFLCWMTLHEYTCKSPLCLLLAWTEQPSTSTHPCFQSTSCRGCRRTTLDVTSLSNGAWLHLEWGFRYAGKPSRTFPWSSKETCPSFVWRWRWRLNVCQCVLLIANWALNFAWMVEKQFIKLADNMANLARASPFSEVEKTWH